MGCGTLIGAALSAVGAGTQLAASSKAKGQMTDVMNAQQAEQRKLRQQGSEVFDKSLALSTPDAAKQQIGQGQDAYRTAAQNTLAVPLGLPNNATTSTDAAANQARASLGADAMANYAGYGQLGQEQSIKDRAAQSQLGVINSQSQYANSLLPGELTAAQHSYDGLSGIGSLLGTAGTLTGLANAAGLFSSSPMAGLGHAASNLGTSTLASPLWLGQVAPQTQKPFFNFGIGGY